MEEFLINIEDDELNDLLMEKKEVQDVLKDHLGNIDEIATREGGDTVATWLAGLHREEDGVPEVQDFTIGEANFDIVDLKGDFKIFYTISHFLSSEDKKNDQNNRLEGKTIKYNFIVDVESKQIDCKAQLYPTGG